jgi:hypothetical protein
MMGKIGELFECLNFIISFKNQKKKWTRFLILDIFKNVHFQKMDFKICKKGDCHHNAAKTEFC